MAYGDIRKCSACPAFWIEDDQMYEDPNTCPHCGVDVGDHAAVGLGASSSYSFPVASVPFVAIGWEAAETITVYPLGA